ncbi:lymphocyte antigen 86 isoform X2 [Ailuropoda melanoleuca]|uniref:lymphocyte antigen 86 isoform X2 n=1 Tax=Ailuropoda melanoleuca TaxID=9646 RepID=UPI0009478759|nr:lymphocyte antigen 86 isoform X2 [Ailuropoda melanoleuca]
MQDLAMKGFTVALLVWTLISPSSCSKAWPTHTVCRDGDLEVLYQSCGEDIKELFLDIALFNKGSSILNFSYPICEEDLPKFSFCGRRKGEQIYFAGPINNPGIEIPEGEYQVLLELYNENRSTVACANATVTHS